MKWQVSYSEGIEGELNEMQEKLEGEGKVVLFNPPPFGPYHCPVCGNKLETRKNE